MRRASVLLLALLTTAAQVDAKTTRVRFPPGRTTLILKGKTTGGPSESGGMDPVEYALRARRGQQMTVHLTSAKKNAVFTIYLPGNGDTFKDGANDSELTDWSGTLPKSGDYNIIVFPRDETTNPTFTLEINVR